MMTDFDKLKISENSKQDFMAIATEKASEMRKAVEEDRKKIREAREERPPAPSVLPRVVPAVPVCSSLWVVFTVS